MGLYDNAYFSVYEEIKRFYPVWYWDVLEMDAIWRAQGKQLDQVREAVQRLISNNFIATSDDQAVTALEEVFGVVTDTDRTIEDRRQLLLSLLRGGGHVGAREIKEIMAAFTDAPCNVDFAGATVYVRINRDSGDTFTLDDCYMTLARKIPAHLDLVINVISPIESPSYRAVSMAEYKEEEI